MTCSPFRLPKSARSSTGLAMIDGAPGAVWARAGVPQVAFLFTVTGDEISAISLIADHGLLQNLEISYLEP